MLAVVAGDAVCFFKELARDPWAGWHGKCTALVPNFLSGYATGHKKTARSGACWAVRSDESGFLIFLCLQGCSGISGGVWLWWQRPDAITKSVYGRLVFQAPVSAPTGLFNYSYMLQTCSFRNHLQNHKAILDVFEVKKCLNFL